jgi:Protein of unknown function (DUF3106)
MKRATVITRWMAGVCLAAAIALSSPCLAQRNNFRSPAQQKRDSQPLPKHQQAAPRQKQQGHVGDWLRRHKDLPPAEQERALENEPGFRHLPPERQQQLRDRLHHFSSLPPQQQQHILSNMDRWAHLTPEQKQQARQVYGQMQQLPPERRRMVNTAIRDLRAMPPVQREQIINSDHFKGMFSPQERDIMRGAARLPLAPPENGRGEEPLPPEE